MYGLITKIPIFNHNQTSNIMVVLGIFYKYYLLFRDPTSKSSVTRYVLAS